MITADAVVTTLAIVAALAFAVTMGMADAGNASANLVPLASEGSAESCSPSRSSRTSLARCCRAPRSRRPCSARSTSLEATSSTVLAAGIARRGRPPRARDPAGLAGECGTRAGRWLSRAQPGPRTAWTASCGAACTASSPTACSAPPSPWWSPRSSACCGGHRRATGRASVLQRASVRRCGRSPARNFFGSSSGFVGFADGSNDGQKAMAVIVGGAGRQRLRRPAAASRSGSDSPSAFTLALGTLLGARVLAHGEPPALCESRARRRDRGVVVGRRDPRLVGRRRAR